VSTAEKLALSAAEAGELVGVSESMIRHLVRKGKLARVPDVGDRLLIARVELERWVTSTVGEAS